MNNKTQSLVNNIAELKLPQQINLNIENIILYTIKNNSCILFFDIFGQTVVKKKKIT